PRAGRPGRSRTPMHQAGRAPAPPAFCVVRHPGSRRGPAPLSAPSSQEHPMSLKQQLTSDMKAAMKAGDKQSLGVIRLVNAAIKQREVDERVELDDTQVIAVLDKMV